MSTPTCLSRTLVVCTGKDCRNDKGFDKLVDMAGRIDGSLESACQGLCHGPVVGVREGEDVRWYEKMRSKSMRERLVEVIASGRAAKDLRKHEAKKRHNVVRHPRRLKRLNA